MRSLLRVGARVRGNRERAARDARGVPEGAERLAELLGAVALATSSASTWVRRWFSEAPGVGAADAALGARWRAARRAGAATAGAGPAPEVAAIREQWLFLDTETTGLMGGTGTYPFMVGIAWWDAGGLEVEQFFMREQSEEHALLMTLAERMAERRVLVTFNGKSFDWPLLETRYRMTRKIRPPAPRAHLDFLHPARNLWRLRLGIGAAGGTGKACAGVESRGGRDFRN